MKTQIDSNFVYDPKRSGYDENLWETLSGTPAISSNKLRVSNAGIIHYADLFRGFYNFILNVPATPTNAYLTGGTSATAVVATWNAVEDGEFAITIDGTAYDITGLDFSDAEDMDGVALVIQTALQSEVGSYVTCVWDTDHFVITARISITVASAVSEGTGTDISGAGGTAFMDSDVGAGDEAVTAATNSNKKFGLFQASKGLKCYFELRGDTLVAVTSDDTGTAQETEITWDDTNWTGNDISFEIDWMAMGVRFKVNGVNKCTHETRIPRSSLSLYIDNDLADNLDLSLIECIGVESVL